MIKTVYIIRHGEVNPQTDALGRLLIHRPDATLSESGKQDMVNLSEEFKKHYITLDALYTSPSIRAEQAADILSEKLKTPSPIRFEGLHDYLEGSNKEEWIGKPKIVYNEYYDIENKIPEDALVNDVKQTLTHIIKETTPKTIQMILKRDINLDRENNTWDKRSITELQETLEAIIRESPG